ncbi:MAG: tRNA lysidine(34) synthetase TilS [Deltaproteobacteria bacterium]|jgi:tRNA(Ile)-lysidine synthase|nr:tRNA lysidine(34) synthetase TilS [Deltaproteobacteria bacterium]
MRPAEIEERFAKALLSLANDFDKKFVLAFSGGVDSTALLALMTQVRPPASLIAAHLNHNLRAQSTDEANRAQEVAASLNVPFILGQAETRTIAQNRGRGLEDAARKARYDFLAQVANSSASDYILTAHQANDQAETMLLKIFRGGGPSSWVGIKPKQDRLLRPLLSFSREELLAYVNYKKLPFIHDPSNDDPSFRRNHLRIAIWPELLKQNQGLVFALGRAANLALAEEEFWDSRVNQLALQLAEFLPNGQIRLKAASLESLSLAERRRLVLFLLRRIKIPTKSGGENVPLAGVDKFLEFAKESRVQGQGLDLPGGRRVARQGMYLYIGPSSRFPATYGL